MTTLLAIGVGTFVSSLLWLRAIAQVEARQLIAARRSRRRAQIRDAFVNGEKR